MNIDRFARWYRWVEYAAFGQALERRRFALLHVIAGARRVLVLGEGDGRALRRLLEIAPQAEIDVVESSREMIRLARQRIGSSLPVLFRHEDARFASLPRACYDAVVTLFFLDCFAEHEARPLIQKVAQSMAPGGRWIVSDFAIPARGWPRWHARMWLWTMYRFFGIVSGMRVRSLPPIQRLLREAGFEREQSEDERWRLMRSEVWIKGIKLLIVSGCY